MANHATSILLVEDDAHLLELLLETFEDVGYLVKGAGGPDEALRLGKKYKFDMVISDVRMAGATDGIGVLQALKKIHPQLKCIVITGYASEEAPGRAINIQVDDYVYKPFRLPDMLDTVKRVLASDAERQSYLGQLSSLLISMPKKLMQKVEESKVGGLRTALEAERDKTLQGFFVGIRSDHLTRGAALEMWDELEKLESSYQQLQDGSNAQGDFIRNLGRGYRQTQEKIINRSRAGSVGNYDKRDPQKMSRASFYSLYDQVRAGKVTPEQLRVAFRLRPLGPDASKLSPALQPLHGLLFSRG